MWSMDPWLQYASVEDKPHPSPYLGEPDGFGRGVIGAFAPHGGVHFQGCAELKFC